MYELHKNEQYFFDSITLKHLTSFLNRFDRIATLCAPMLGQSLVKEKHPVTILDIDERFNNVPGFLYWNIYKPEWLYTTFGIIVCDPPFFNVSLSQLFKAIRMLSHNNFDQPLLISYLRRRKDAVSGSFNPFKLQPTGFYPSYVTVQKIERNEIEFFGNLSKADMDDLAFLQHAGD
jgi:hypothetical protein